MSRLPPMCLALAFFLAGANAQAASEPTIEVGDTIDFSVASIPVLQRHLVVGADGQIVVPLVGELPAAGRTLSSLREKVRSLIQTRPFVYRTSEGKEVLTNVAPDEVALNVSEYRPIYVLGDVARPGQIAFRAGLTVRQAIAVAGGYDPFRQTGRMSRTEVAALRGEMSALWIQYTRLRARQDRLRRDLGKPDPGPAAVNIPLPPDLLAEIVNGEVEVGLARETKYRREREHLERAMKDADRQARVLFDQARKEAEGAELDAGEVERINDLYRKNIVPIGRAIDMRRASLVSATRALQTEVQAETIRKERESLLQRYQTLEDERRASLLTALEEAGLDLSIMRSRLRTVADQLPVAEFDPAGQARQVLLHRRADVQRSAAEDEELRPGDVVEIKPGAAQRAGL